MHYTALVVVPPDTDLDDENTLKELLEARLNPFDEQRDVVPWKDYQDAQSIEWMQEHYTTPPGDLAALVPHMEDWCGHPGGVDEHGLYALTTNNPCGLWDWWVIGGRWDKYMQGWGVPTLLDGNAIRLKDLPPYDMDKFGTYSMVLAEPKPCWLTRRDWNHARKEFEENNRYASQVAELCARYPEHIGVLVDYHS